MAKNQKAATSLNRQENSYRIKKIVLLGVFSAIAFVSTWLASPVKIISFLSFDPKDAVIAIISFIFGPLSGIIVTLIVSFLEMITFSQTGIIGFIMNVISTSCFFLPSAIIYKHKKNLTAAIIGLLCGTALMTSVMLLWNYIVTPFYMNVPRESVAEMLLPVFLPFNLLKAGINSSIALILYKAIVGALRKTHLIPETTANDTTKRPIIKDIIVFSIFALLSFLLVILAYNGMI